MLERVNLEEKLGVIDYAVYQQYLDGGKQDKVLFKKYSDNVMDALMRTGAVLIKNAPIHAMTDRMKKVSKEFFALPVEQKESYAFPNSLDNRGYVSYGKKKPQDYKEFFHVDLGSYEALKGKPFDEIENLINADDMNKQLELVDIIKDYRDTVIEFTEKATQMGDSFIEVAASVFELDEPYVEQLKKGNSVLRLLRYPGFDAELLKNVENPTRAVAHIDASFITFVPPSDEWGLWVVHKDDVEKSLGTTFASKNELDKIPKMDRIFIPPKSPYIFMNAGRPFEIFTDALVTGTLHGVDSMPGNEAEERYSNVFFKHIGWDLHLKPWDKAVEMRNNIDYFTEKGPHPITVAEYVLDSEKYPDGTPVPRELQKRTWIEPSADKPVPIYKPN